MHEETSKVEKIIAKFNLQQHPEGGFFAETYRSHQYYFVDQGEPTPSNRNASTAILFLLTSLQYSAWHRLKSDEIWHFYDGSAITIYTINEKGEYHEHLLGNPFVHAEDASFQIVIPKTRGLQQELKMKIAMVLLAVQSHLVLIFQILNLPIVKT